MNEHPSLEWMVATLMVDEVSGRAPDRLLEDVLSTTGQLRPLPRWLAVLKEPPMRVHTRVAVGIPARGLVIILALAALLAVGLTGAILASNLLQAPKPLATDDWPMFRGDATRAGVSLSGPAGLPVVRWEFHAQGAVTQNISVVGDSVFASSDDGVIHALRLADGTERWRASLGSGATSGPTVVNGLAYAWDSTGIVHAFDVASGSERWRSSLALGSGLSNPVVGGGSLYVGTSDGHLVAFDAASGAERWRAALSGVGGAVNSPALGDGVLYVGTASAGFFAVDAATGGVRWRLDTGQDETQTAVIGNGIAYIGAAADAATGHLRAVDAQTGRVLWQIDEPLQSPTLANGVAYSGSSQGWVTARDATTGVERWRVQFHGTTRAPAVVGGVVYEPADGEHRIYALDATTGGELWHFDLDGNNECCIAVAKGSVFVGTSPGTVYDIGGDGSNTKPAPVIAVAPPSSGPAATTPTSSGAPASSSAAVPVLAKFVWKAVAPGGRFIPNGIVLAPDGTLWVADPYNDRFALFRQDGSFVGYWGSSGTGPGEFRLTRSNGDGYGAVAFESDGSFFVLDVGNRRVQAFDKQRRLVKAWGTFGMGPGQYDDPVGIAVGRDGVLYVLDDVRGVAERYDRHGNVLGSLNVFSNTTTGFNKANSLAIDPAGDVYVSQIDPNQVAEFDPTGKLLRTIGADGAGQFQDQPGFMSIDAAGRLYVNQGAGRGSAPGIEVFDSAGQLVTAWGATGSSDGDVTFPTGLLLDGTGNLYVGDAAALSGPGESRIEKFRLLPPLDR